jgi:hypothetical protein
MANKTRKELLREWKAKEKVKEKGKKTPGTAKELKYFWLALIGLLVWLIEKIVSFAVLVIAFLVVGWNHLSIRHAAVPNAQRKSHVSSWFRMKADTVYHIANFIGGAGGIVLLMLLFEKINKNEVPPKLVQYLFLIPIGESTLLLIFPGLQEYMPFTYIAGEIVALLVLYFIVKSGDTKAVAKTTA